MIHNMKARAAGSMIATAGLVMACAAVCLFSTGRKNPTSYLKPPERGFGNAQILLDAANGTNTGQGIRLGVKELEIAQLMKERNALLSNRDVLRALLESEVVYSSELLAALSRCNKNAAACSEQLSDSVKQSVELALYLAKCMENTMKGFHIINYYFGVVDKDELAMLAAENKKAGIEGKGASATSADAQLQFRLFDYFIKEIAAQPSVKGQLPRRVGAVLTDKKGDCDEQAIAFAWQALVAGWKARVVFVDYGKTAHAYPQILIGNKKEFDKFVIALKKHYKLDDKLFKKIVQMGPDSEDGNYWFTFDTTGPVPGLRPYPDYDKRTRVVYPNGH